jgi:hypothetical protein
MVVDGHLGTTQGELLRDDSANPARGAGDKGHSVGKVHDFPL